MRVIEEGFYVDPETKKTFFVKKSKKVMLIPSWVKANPADWKKLGRSKTKIMREKVVVK